MAWNVCLVSDVANCLQLEYDMAQWVRQHTTPTGIIADLSRGQGRGDEVNFSMAGELARAADRELDVASNIPALMRSYYHKNRRLHNELWSKVFDPALKIISKLYMCKFLSESPHKVHGDKGEQERQDAIVGSLPMCELWLLRNASTTQLTDKGVVICYLCGGACIVQAVAVCVAPHHLGRTSTSRSGQLRLLCDECYKTCHECTRVIEVAQLLTVRSNYNVYFREYPGVQGLQPSNSSSEITF